MKSLRNSKILKCTPYQFHQMGSGKVKLMHKCTQIDFPKEVPLCVVSYSFIALFHFTVQFSCLSFQMNVSFTMQDINIFFATKTCWIGILSQKGLVVFFYVKGQYYDPSNLGLLYWGHLEAQIFPRKVGWSVVWRTIKEWRSKAGIIQRLRLKSEEIAKLFSTWNWSIVWIFENQSYCVSNKRETTLSSMREYWSDFWEF